jgi:hypothetical protein
MLTPLQRRELDFELDDSLAFARRELGVDELVPRWGNPLKGIYTNWWQRVDAGKAEKYRGLSKEHGRQWQPR